MAEEGVVAEENFGDGILARVADDIRGMGRRV
jgi:hypothetical protein